MMEKNVAVAGLWSESKVGSRGYEKISGALTGYQRCDLPLASQRQWQRTLYRQVSD